MCATNIFNNSPKPSKSYQFKSTAAHVEDGADALVGAAGHGVLHLPPVAGDGAALGGREEMGKKRGKKNRQPRVAPASSRN